LADHGEGAGVGGGIVEELTGPVGTKAEGLDFVCEQGGVGVGIDVTGFLRFQHGAIEGGHPLAHNHHDAIAYGAAAAVEFEGCGSEKTAAGEKLTFHVAQPAFNQMPKTRHALGRAHRRAANSIDEKLARGFDSGELQILLGTEVSEKAALAHFQVVSEAADGEAFETLEGGEMYGAEQDSSASAEAAGLAAWGGFAECGRGERHEGSVTQNK